MPPPAGFIADKPPKFVSGCYKKKIKMFDLIFFRQIAAFRGAIPRPVAGGGGGQRRRERRPRRTQGRPSQGQRVRRDGRQTGHGPLGPQEGERKPEGRHQAALKVRLPQTSSLCQRVSAVQPTVGTSDHR